MAYDKHLAERVNRTLDILKIPFEEKFMMGGVCYMINDKMCVGVVKNELMVRIDPEGTEDALKKTGCRLMDFTGKSMKGFFIYRSAGSRYGCRPGVLDKACPGIQSESKIEQEEIANERNNINQILHTDPGQRIPRHADGET